jgi:hypothetical protein
MVWNANTEPFARRRNFAFCSYRVDSLGLATCIALSPQMVNSVQLSKSNAQTKSESEALHHERDNAK